MLVSESRQQFNLMKPHIYGLGIVKEVNNLFFPFFNFFPDEFLQLDFGRFSNLFKRQLSAYIMYFISLVRAYINFFILRKHNTSSRYQFKQSKTFFTYGLRYRHWLSAHWITIRKII